ncbi:MAG: S24 family peptidase [Anaerolineales bacterium]
MRVKDLIQILDHLDTGDNQEIAALSQRVRDFGLISSSPDELVSTLQEKLVETFTEPYYEKSPYFYFLLACASYLAGRSDAISHAERAESQFKNQGKKWDQSLCNWLLSLFLWECGEKERSQEKINAAINSFSTLAQVCSTSGLYKDNTSCLNVLYEIKLFKEEIDANLIQPSGDNGKKTKENSFSHPSPQGQEGHLLLLQLPTYTSVQAGSNGPIWAEHDSDNDYTETNRVSIGNRHYIIFSVNRGDRRITIDPNRQYGWAEVKGNSMNVAQPTHIEAGNMVLFYQSSDAPENAFVIVSCPTDTGAGFSFMVKRWNKADQVFLSDSSEFGHSPIPCDKECKIIGIVAAVAKLSL